jgi:four helix bundle protein
MGEASEELKRRSKAFAAAVLKLIDRLPPTAGGQVVARQLAKSATSVGANYRSTCNARSRAEFIAKLGVVVEEADETCYWIELAVEGRMLADGTAVAIQREAIELRAIFSRSLGTARANQRLSQLPQSRRSPNDQMTK